MFTEFRLTGGGQVPVYCNWNMSKTCQKLFRNPCLLCRLANIHWNSASCNHCGGQPFSTLAKWWLCWSLQNVSKVERQWSTETLRTQAPESIYHIWSMVRILDLTTPYRCFFCKQCNSPPIHQWIKKVEPVDPMNQNHQANASWVQLGSFQGWTNYYGILSRISRA
jgi:hypothetical protein